ncbi:hypothetical protein EVAR_69982_1 [Eumeta japonica]|uniref:Uncharacterized protein n=1 Tax=Eumeta variegata TaxID=151549 RepID=A0A4C1ZAA7_EUMVA|nr:hypothetical protein EVAR_69982_1 [Eumeta japonica]
MKKNERCPETPGRYEIPFIRPKALLGLKPSALIQRGLGSTSDHCTTKMPVANALTCPRRYRPVCWSEAFFFPRDEKEAKNALCTPARPHTRVVWS